MHLYSYIFRLSYIKNIYQQNKKKALYEINKIYIRRYDKYG